MSQVSEPILTEEDATPRLATQPPPGVQHEGYIELAPDRPIDGARLLSCLSRAIRRYIMVSTAQADVLALWIVHAYAVAAFDITPYLHITSAQKGCGKTRLLKVLALLVPKPLRTAHITPAALYRSMDKFHPTLLLDEIDQQMKGSKEAAAVIRGVLNCGFERGTPYTLCVKGHNGQFDVANFDTFGPKALAGIGQLWETVADRSLPVLLQRRLASEAIQPFRTDDAEWHLTPLKQASELWASANLDFLRRARPQVPAINREADLLEPLLAIADLARNPWPDRARTALMEVCQGRLEATGNTSLELLADVREVFGDAVRLSTQNLLEWLPMQEGVTVMSARWLAKKLRQFGIAPRNVRIGGQSPVKGYERSDLEPVWERYLGPSGPRWPAAATAATSGSGAWESGEHPSSTEGRAADREI